MSNEIKYNDKIKVCLIFQLILKKEREFNAISQQKLADLLNVDRTLVSKWERGVCEPGLECLAEICRILNISSDDFLEINNNEAEEIIKINEYT